MNQLDSTSNFILDKTKCKDCLHFDVCIYRIQKKMPRMKERKAQVFNNVVTITECEYYRKEQA